MSIFEEQYQRISTDKGFIAALDQSGGSTPKALLGYGISETEYKTDADMFTLIHEMRDRIISDSCFTGDKILGVILFERTMNETIEGVATPHYLWKKNIVPFLKVDKGLKAKDNDVQLMKEIPNLASRIVDAKEKGVFGTKMRSVIFGDNLAGITAIVQQQFDFALTILENGLVPIIEPEVDIYTENKKETEATLKGSIINNLERLNSDQKIILKLTLPSKDNFYKELVDHPKVLRVFALSGGYDIDKANTLLANNNGMVASFSRALLNDLRINQSSEEFTKVLSTAIDSIYKASIT